MRNIGCVWFWLCSLGLGACTVTGHEVVQAQLGTVSDSKALLGVIDTPGPIVVESVRSADWVVDRSGLINLDSPQAKEAGLVDGEEPIGIYFHALRHPQRGLFVVDTGVGKAVGADPEGTFGVLSSLMHADKLKLHTSLADYLARQSTPLAGVLLTHMHLDHVMGMADVPANVAIYAGPGEATSRQFMNLFVRGYTDTFLAGKSPIAQFDAGSDAAGRFQGVRDVFGDQTLWALAMPGHTPGSMAFIARTQSGPVLFTGDTCHTAWGWAHGVEPGSFTADQAQNKLRLLELKKLAAEHPQLVVHLGHQEL